MKLIYYCDAALISLHIYEPPAPSHTHTHSSVHSPIHSSVLTHTLQCTLSHTLTVFLLFREHHRRRIIGGGSMRTSSTQFGRPETTLRMKWLVCVCECSIMLSEQNLTYVRNACCSQLDFERECGSIIIISCIP